MSQQYIATVTDYTIVTYSDVAYTMVLLYDYLLTFRREVELVWNSPWTLVKVLFFLSRYLPFVDMGCRIWADFRQEPTFEACLLTLKLNTWLFYVGVIFPEIIFTCRTWAVWNRDRRLTIVLPIFFALCFVPCIPIIIIFLDSLEFGSFTMPHGVSGCVITEGSSILFIGWLLLTIYETGVFIMMLIKGIEAYKISGNSRTFQVVFRDGLLYYLCLFAFAVSNLIYVAIGPSGLPLLITGAQRAIHSILAVRSVLDIRDQVANKSHVSFSAALTQPRSIEIKHVGLVADSTNSAFDIEMEVVNSQDIES